MKSKASLGLLALVAVGCAPAASPGEVIIAPTAPAAALVVEARDEPRPAPRVHFATTAMMSIGGVELDRVDCYLRDDAPTAFMTALAAVADLHDRLAQCAPVSSHVAWEVVAHRVTEIKVNEPYSAACVEGAFRELRATSDGSCSAELSVKK
jgi:hypothetical protein